MGLPCEEGVEAAVELAPTAGVGYRTTRKVTPSSTARIATPPSEMRSVVASATSPTTAGPAITRDISVVADPTAVPRSAGRAARPTRLTIVGAHTEQPAPAFERVGQTIRFSKP